MDDPVADLVIRLARGESALAWVTAHRLDAAGVQRAWAQCLDASAMASLALRVHPSALAAACLATAQTIDDEALSRAPGAAIPRAAFVLRGLAFYAERAPHEHAVDLLDRERERLPAELCREIRARIPTLDLARLR